MPPNLSKPDINVQFDFKKLNLCFNKYRKARNRYIRCYTRWRDNRRANLANVRLLIIGLEQTRHGCNITSLSGALGGVVGGVLTAVGLITMPFSLGATTPLFVTGTVMLVSAGAAGLGGSAADVIISRSKCKAAQSILDRDVELTLELQLLEKEHAIALEGLKADLQNLATNHPYDYSQLRHYVFSEGGAICGALRAGSSVIRMVKLIRTVHVARIFKLPVGATTLIDHMNPIPFMNISSMVDDVLEAGGRATVAAGRGARTGLIATGVLCAVGLALDITNIVYSARQIHVHNKKRKNGVGVDKASALLPEDNIQNEKFLAKVKRKIAHPFKRDYISERAEKLKRYAEKIDTELFEMENDKVMRNLVVTCRCRECAPVGGGQSVHCCHQDPLYWNSVRTEHTVLTHNTPSLCVTQHPGFALNYLNVANLEKHFPHLKNQQTSGKFKSRCRILRFASYILFVRNTTEMDPGMRIPDCVQRAIVHTFQPEEGEDIWAQRTGLAIQNMYIEEADKDAHWAWILNGDSNDQDINSNDHKEDKTKLIYHRLQDCKAEDYSLKIPY